MKILQRAKMGYIQMTIARRCFDRIAETLIGKTRRLVTPTGDIDNCSCQQATRWLRTPGNGQLCV